MICTNTRTRLNTKEVVPTLRFEITLLTYGMQISGEVPRFALMDRDAPNEIMNKDRRYTHTFSC